MFGAQSNCSTPSPVSGAANFPEVNTGSGDRDSREQTWMPNGWDRTMSWTAWSSGSTSTMATGTRTNSTGTGAGNDAGMYGSDTGEDTGQDTTPGYGTESDTKIGSVGVYVGVHDPESRLKMMPAYCTTASQGRLALAGLRAVHVPDSFADASTTDFTLPYPVIVAAFNGSWWDAAQIYRRWALQSAQWTRRGSLSTRSDVPAWVLRAPLWIKLEGVSSVTASTVNAFQTLLGDSDVEKTITDLGVHWYQWNKEAFDTHYPIYTARDGFAAAVSQIQKSAGGVIARVVPYTNGRLWDPAGPLPHEPAAQSTCNGRNGSAYREVYGSGVVFSVMNPASTYMRQEWSSVVGNITNRYNLSGIYSDQISCSHSQVRRDICLFYHSATA